MGKHTKTTLLTILDGWGYTQATKHNAIHAAHTPFWDSLLKQYPNTTISGSGADVGLPASQMGNSEVGHLNLGAGRIVYQDLTRIHKAIEDGSFQQHPVWAKTFEALQTSGGTLHIMGLLSPGGVHSHEDHILALVELAAARGVKHTVVHAFLDGRDTPPNSAKASLLRVEASFQRLGSGCLATLCGRYYAMDRDQRWDRVELAYDLLTQGNGVRTAPNACAGLQQAYDANETDEFVAPTWLDNADPNTDTITSGDAVVFMNFRADRARELSHAFLDEDFDSFVRKQTPTLSNFISLTEYDSTLTATVAYPPERLPRVLGAYAAELGLRQLRAAETEKYAHVTFFFNGGEESPFPGEDRKLIPSPKVATYDLQPEMSAPALTDALIEAIESNEYDLIICNYANADMVGHTGNFDAAVKAIEALDQCLSRLIPSLLAHGGEALITADHGNAECMYDEQSNQPHTAHTNEVVPLVYVGERPVMLRDNGVLSDVAPSLLTLMDLAIPVEMTGKTLVTRS